MNFRKAFIRLVLISVVLLSSSIIFGFTDQATTERILGENKDFIEFINVSITNFADQKKDDFRKIYEMHFNADVAYLQSDYKRAYKKIYACQGEMAPLFETLLRDRYLEDSKNMLDRIAPGIIKSRSARARLYLNLGYRDRTVSMTHFTIGEASNPKLFSYKLYKYQEGIKVARRSKRYAFLALFESQTPETKKSIYEEVARKEVKGGNLFYSRFLDKDGEAFVTELHLGFEEAEKRDEKAAQSRKTPQVKTENKPGEKTEAAGDKEPVEGEAEKTFEKKLVKRVRFRKEARAAQLLQNHEFDQAEDNMREYISDFNFKLITATFDVLKKQAAQNPSAAKLDFDALNVHLMDNYVRLTKQSAIETFLDNLKVEDDVNPAVADEAKNNLNKEAAEKQKDKAEEMRDTADAEKKNTVSEEKKDAGKEEKAEKTENEKGPVK
jgi:hypothetical protein